LFDVLEYVFNSEIKPIKRSTSSSGIRQQLRLVERQTKEFIEFVLKYIETGVEELRPRKTSNLTSQTNISP
jgi:hypothetical protein